MLHAYPYTIAATVAIQLLLFVFTGAVAAARGRHGVKAPACEGPDGFNRVYRVHQNMLEQMIQFLPLLWLAALVAGDAWGGVSGALFIAGRLIYRRSYLADPAKRGPGMMITLAGSALAVFAVALVTVRTLL